MHGELPEQLRRMQRSTFICSLTQLLVVCSLLDDVQYGVCQLQSHSCVRRCCIRRTHETALAALLLPWRRPKGTLWGSQPQPSGSQADHYPLLGSAICRKYGLSLTAIGFGHALRLQRFVRLLVAGYSPVVIGVSTHFAPTCMPVKSLPSQCCCSEVILLHAVCAVHDGYVLQKSVSRSPLGGSLLSRCMLQVAESILAEKNFSIRPRYSIKRTERQPGVFEVSCCLCLCISSTPTS